MDRFNDLCTARKKQYGDKFSTKDLSAQFVHAFNMGNTYRIQVDFGYAKTWGYVGITTGWVPCFMLMRRRGQHDSSQLLKATDKIISTRTLQA